VNGSTLLDEVAVDEDSVLALIASRYRKRREDLRAAFLFSRIEDSSHFRAEGCASIGEFGERYGFSATEARQLARAGRAVAAFPSLRTFVLKGRVTLEAASVLERVLGDPKLRGPHSIRTWIHWAKTESARRLRNRVRARLEEIRTGERVHETTVHLTDRGRDDLDRARVVIGDRVNRAVTASEVVETAVGYFLDREDPQRRDSGTRRVGSTVENRSRHVPTDARRLVHDRSGGICEVPFCDATHGLELAHVKAHKDGGGREPKDLFHGCHGHHVTYDAGWFRVDMVPDEKFGWRPVFHFGPVPRKGALAVDGDGRRWPDPPHFRPNPLDRRPVRWRCSRPPPV
jgi:hypothetical protein